MSDSIDTFVNISNSSLAIVGPLLAAIIFSDSYLIEKQTHYLNFIYMRISRKKYMSVKLMVNSLAASIVITCASIIILAILYMILGFNVKTGYIPSTYYEGIYQQSKILYLIINFATSFVFYSICSIVSLGISPWINNRYLAIISFFVIYFLSGSLLKYMKMPFLNINVLFNLCVQSTSHLILYQSILFVIGCGLFCWGVMKKGE